MNTSRDPFPIFYPIRHTVVCRGSSDLTCPRLTRWEGILRRYEDREAADQAG